ncbi:MAG: hypothetical protein Kow0098_10130 [Ignavibacteriaceae bacterium]
MNSEILLKEADKFSDYKLQEKQDLLVIIDCSLKIGIDEFEEIIFTAKYISGLLRVMQKLPGIQAKNPELIQRDLTENINKIIAKLRDVISFSDESVRLRFEKKYFEANQKSFNNLRTLITDLEWIKIYRNAQKRGEV